MFPKFKLPGGSVLRSITCTEPNVLVRPARTVLWASKRGYDHGTSCGRANVLRIGLEWAEMASKRSSEGYIRVSARPNPFAASPASTDKSARPSSFFTSPSFIKQARQTFFAAQARSVVKSSIASPARTFSTSAISSAPIPRVPPQPRSMSLISSKQGYTANTVIDDLAAVLKFEMTMSDLWLKHPDLDVASYWLNLQRRMESLLKGVGAAQAFKTSLAQQTTNLNHTSQIASSARPQLATFTANPQAWKTSFQRSAHPHTLSLRTPITRIENLEPKLCEYTKTPAIGRNAVHAPVQSTLWSASAQGSHTAHPVQASIVVPTYTKVPLLPRGRQFECQYHRNRLTETLDAARSIKRKDVSYSQIQTLDRRTRCLALRCYLGGTMEAVYNAVARRFPGLGITQGRILLLADEIGIRTVAKVVWNIKERAELSAEESALRLAQDLRISIS